MNKETKKNKWAKDNELIQLYPSKRKGKRELIQLQKERVVRGRDSMDQKK